MSKRAEALATRIEHGTAAVIAYIETLSDAQWKTVCLDDARSVGVLALHVAAAYAVEVDLTRMLASGQAIPLTWEMADEANSQHAEANAAVERPEVLVLLRKNGAYCANAIRELTDEQLDRVAPIGLNFDVPLSTQYFIEEHPITHPFRHMASMRAALAAT